MEASSEPTAHELTRNAILSAEQRLSASFADDAGQELAVADDAASFLVTVMTAVGERSGNVQVDADGTPTGGAVDVLQLFALQMIGARAVRVIRAARAVLATGYESESRAHDRILFELLAHRKEILADPTGAEAKAWMDGKRVYGIAARVAKMAPGDLYKNLSMDSHGDARPLLRLLNLEEETMLLQPVRTSATRASLLMHAGLARDHAVLIAGHAGIELSGVHSLDDEISAGWARLEADAPAGAA